MHLWITIARYNLYSRLYRKVDRTGSWATGQEDCGCCGKQRKSSVQTTKVRLYEHRIVLSIDEVYYSLCYVMKKFFIRIFIPSVHMYPFLDLSYILLLHLLNDYNSWILDNEISIIF